MLTSLLAKDAAFEFPVVDGSEAYSHFFLYSKSDAHRKTPFYHVALKLGRVLLRIVSITVHGDMVQVPCGRRDATVAKLS
jgi:hypothetical protein